MHASPTHRPVHWGWLFGTAVLVTLFLYFIDGGRFSLHGLLHAGNAGPLCVYLLALLAGLFGMAMLFAHRPAGLGRDALVLMLGSAVGVLLAMGVFFMLHGPDQAS